MEHCDLPLIFRGLTTTFSFLTFIIATIALKTWRKQIKYNAIYENALQFEASMTKFTMLTSSEADITGNPRLDGCADDITSSYWLLLQRKFMVKETKNLYEAFNNSLKHSKETGNNIVPKKEHDALVNNLNIFSNKLGKVF